ncbi:hypothetical protein MAQ5080_01747 [Marinomonas aquimarina]|uniref:Arylsulfotransferase (ASST) n=1 Tax=Marinomonas aquimarina TaxID=295068 RepID=A0A1A8TE79_9GAMM|nr:arylsulfotransferase family protein [Marinomonas aquimarina]SBS30690.1 hypothetical protein MAQ5080_01747 [Marinomonas aquimarina]
MRKFFDISQLPKLLFTLSRIIILVLGGFVYGLISYGSDLFPLPQLRMAMNLVSSGDITRDPRYEHMQPSRGQGGGVTVNLLPEDNAYILMSGFFDDENQIRLIKRDGTIVKKWSLDYLKHFPHEDSRTCNMLSPLYTDTHGVHLTPKGEVVFNYEYCGSVKLNQCGQVMWTVNQPTHHSIVPAEAGGYWGLSRLKWNAKEEPDRFPPFTSPGNDRVILEDTIIRIAEDGDILETISIPALLMENNLESLMTANGLLFSSRAVLDSELVHANKVAELPSDLADDFPLFSAGDLAVSVKRLNLVFVIDPVSKKIKWYQTGPWIRQHDPEFMADGRISIFNNNVYQTAYVNRQTDLDSEFSTNIMAVDPISRETEVLFGEQPGQEMLSVIRGQHELLNNNHILITEFDAGRVLEVDSEKNIVWEYVNKVDDDYIGEITNAVIYQANYFQEELRNCEQ